MVSSFSPPREPPRVSRAQIGYSASLPDIRPPAFQHRAQAPYVCRRSITSTVAAAPASIDKTVMPNAGHIFQIDAE